MIQFENVSKQYGDFLAIDTLNIEILEKELCVLVGPSGSGKSTLLRMINRLIVLDQGKITLQGRLLSSWKPEDLRRSIGYVIQSVGLFPHMTVQKNVSVVPGLLGWQKARIRARVEELLDLVGLNPALYLSRYPHELSGGEAQRVGVARALAADPAIILMDEPFSAVDPLNRMSLQSEFLSIQKKLKKTVVFVTHDVDEAIRLADRVALLKDGKLIQYDTPEQLLENPINTFASDFVGADRALKRLSRFLVAEFSRPAPRIVLGDILAEQKGAAERFLWVSNANGYLIGSLDRTHLLPGKVVDSDIVSKNVAEMAVRADSSLKDALSTMIGSYARSLPVVDADFRLIGEISFADIESAAGKIP